MHMQEEASQAAVMAATGAVVASSGKVKGRRLRLLRSYTSPKAKPIQKSIPVEVLGSVDIDPRMALKRQQSERSVRRREKLEAVRRHGGHAAGEKQTSRERIRRLVMSLKWQLLLLLTALVDVMMLIVEGANPEAQTAVDVVTAVVLSLFVVDLSLRAHAYRKLLLRSPWAYFDVIVVGLSIILYFVGLAAEDDMSAATTAPTSAARGGRAVRGIVLALRALRSARFAAKMFQVSKSAKTSARHLTGENKKRFVDLEDHVDLDLAYVLPDLIAMSVPATGCTALYRNPLGEVCTSLQTAIGAAWHAPW